MVSLGFSGQVWTCGASGHCWGLAGEDFAPQFWNWRPATYLLSFSLGVPQESDNCFFCDSWDHGGHSIENVIWSGGRDSNKIWW